jgi:hypothetical protein
MNDKIMLTLNILDGIWLVIIMALLGVLVFAYLLERVLFWGERKRLWSDRWRRP